MRREPMFIQIPQPQPQRPAAKNTRHNAMAASKAARQRYNYRTYKVLSTMIRRQTAARFAEVCAGDDLTVNAALKRLIDYALIYGIP